MPRKSNRGAYFKVHYEDLHQCKLAGMSAEQVGVYVSLIGEQWRKQGPIEDDPRRLSLALGWDVRFVRKVVGQIVGLGRLERTPEGRLSSRCMEQEIADYVQKVREQEGAMNPHRGNKEPSKTPLGGNIEDAKNPLRGNKEASLSGDLSNNVSSFNGRGDPDAIFQGSRDGAYARAQDVDVDIEEEKKDFPLPPSGGRRRRAPRMPLVGDLGPEPEENPRQRAAPAEAARMRAAEAAIATYNLAAQKFGFRQCAVITDQRRKRLAKRLDDIGGPENFRKALWEIRNDDWLMGRVEREGEESFRLDLDRLLSTGSGMGDVLARMLDRALAPPDERKPIARDDKSALRANWWQENLAAKTLPPEWWRPQIARYANGTWPVEYLGPGPWDAEACLVPKDLRQELALAAKYPTADGACLEKH